LLARTALDCRKLLQLHWQQILQRMRSHQLRYTPLSAAEILLTRLPKCEGIQIRENPIIFDWPNIERHKKEYEEALWGYFSCEQPQVDVAAYYRAQMPKPPSNAYEMNWVEISEGTVGVFYNGLLWTIVWIVPRDGNMQKTYVIIAQTSYPVDEVCRLDQYLFNQHLAAGG
jgi:hypothetical protein